MTLPAVSSAQVILVRHPPISERYHGICYGQSDVELDGVGKRMSRDIAAELASLQPSRIFHSGRQRTSALANELADRVGTTAVCSLELRERHFGSWELQSWELLYELYGDAMLKMVTEPDTFRPGGGETTFEMRDRVVRWFESLPNDGTAIAVTHGGPIAALLGSERELPVVAWSSLVPACGQSVWFPGYSKQAG